VSDGALLVDKPRGMTSFDVVKKIKVWVHPLKVGHTGTLDPMAEGLLPLVIGEATKLSRFLSAEGKSYLAKVILGTATDTLDAEGKIVSSSIVPLLDDKDLRAALKNFEGDIRQLPPMYSAVHHQGRRLYELAREGKEVERRERSVRIDRLTLIDRGSDWLKLAVDCSSGTYIRSLANDIAVSLGTVGHLAELTRTASGTFKLSDAHKLSELRADSLSEKMIGLTEVLRRFTRVDAPAEIADRLAKGQCLGSETLAKLIPASFHGDNKVCFISPGGSPVILASVELDSAGRPASMKILRQLRPSS